MTKWFDYSFLAFGLLIQVVTYFISLSAGVPVSPVSLVSGCLGVCSVCLLAQGNIWTFFLGFAQVGTYTYLCIEQRFYGEIAINAYYFLTMIYGVYAWKRRLRGDEQTVSTRSLSMPVFGVIILATLFLSGLVGVGLAAYTDDTQPYLDAFTTVPALVAQVLMILVYREHWFVWLAVDVLSVVLWLRAGDFCMAAQYAFWCANCLFGLHRWKSLINHQS
jgi:nicotinamide mononucleotide transporter